mmetsp:Transcript_1104/g.2478  ORF Transcript_1104/g.2478 Transcript_1104/m.2478 type:complete len:288 (+) Transcript_1104:40-903(+)
MPFCTDLSKAVLLVANTLIFLAAGAAVGISIYSYSDVLSDSLTWSGLLLYILIASASLMVVSVVGCCAAKAPPTRKWLLVIYLLVLLGMIAAQALAAVLIYNVNDVLGTLQDHNVDLSKSLSSAEKDAVTYLHDQVGSLYDQGHCTGGKDDGSTAPITFTPVQCTKKSVNQAFDTIIQDRTIEDQDDADKYTACTENTLWTPKGSSPSTATQVFCHARSHIAELAVKYMRPLEYCGIGLAALEALLLLATIFLICRKHRKRQAQLADQRLVQQQQYQPYQGNPAVVA